MTTILIAFLIFLGHALFPIFSTDFLVPPRCHSKTKTKKKQNTEKPPQNVTHSDNTLDLLAKLPQNVTHSKIKDYNA